VSRTYRKFQGTPESVAGLHPFSGAAPLCKTGPYVGTNLRTGRRERLDFHELKAEGKTDATTVLVSGIRGSGKSAWGKTITPRTMLVQAGQGANGYPERMRAWLNNRKPEGGQAEIAELTKFLGSHVVELRRSRSINPFDFRMGMTEWDMLEVAVNMCEFVSGDILHGFQSLALQVGMSKMIREARDYCSIELLAAILRGLTMEDVDAYFRATDENILNSYLDVYDDRPELIKQLGVYLARPHNVPREQLLTDAALVASYLMRVYSGDFGGIFGGAGSMRETFERPMLSLDWSGLNVRARSLVDSLLWKWQTVALDNNDLRLIPHINLGDEEQEAMFSLMHARFMSSAYKKARAFHTVDIRITQFETDISEAGDAGSELRSLAEGISKSFGVRVLFRQPGDDKTRHHLSSLGISDLDIEALTRLPVGCAGIKLANPDYPITFYQHVIMPSEEPLIRSNSANERMMDRRPVSDFNDQMLTDLIHQRAMTGAV
jgi:hypothetical protein